MTEAIASKIREAAMDAGYIAAAGRGNDARNPFPPNTLKHDAWWAGNAEYWGEQGNLDGLQEALGCDY